MRYRKAFSLYSRTLKNGKKVWYYSTYDEFGNRKKFSTGCVKKCEAQKICLTLFKEDRLLPPKRRTFADYTENFFDYDTSVYIKSRLIRGFSFGRTHANTLSQKLASQLVPKFGKVDMPNITSKMIESWMFELKEKGYSNSFINSCYYTMNIIMGEAKRLGDIAENPAENVRPLANNYKEKGVFTVEEKKKLFDEKDSLEKNWDGNRLYYMIVKLISETALRVGEAQALQKEDVDEKFITVRHSWDRTYGVKGTKTGKTRYVPISPALHDELKEMMSRVSGSFIFSCDDGNQPVDHKAIQKWHNRALYCIGITEETRRERNLSLHSWRHYVNTQLRASGIPDSVVQSITGHSTQSMTEHYTHYKADDLCKIFGESVLGKNV